jgi:hypothetical protein
MYFVSTSCWPCCRCRACECSPARPPGREGISSKNGKGQGAGRGGGVGVMCEIGALSLLSLLKIPTTISFVHRRENLTRPPCWSSSLQVKPSSAERGVRGFLPDCNKTTRKRGGGDEYIKRLVVVYLCSEWPYECARARAGRQAFRFPR